MSGRQHAPDAGDILFTNFTPHAGTEMAGMHPCLVLSAAAYSVATGLMVVCPITSTITGSQFEVVLPAHLRTKGCVIAMQISTIDYLARGARFVEPAPAPLLEDVRDIACTILGR